MYKELAKLITNNNRLAYSVTPGGGEKVYVQLVDKTTWDMITITFVPYIIDGRWVAVYEHGAQTKTGEIVGTPEEMLACVKKAETLLNM